MTVAYIAQCPPFPSMMQLISIEGIAWQDCLDLCITSISDYHCLYCATDYCFINCSVDCFGFDCIVDCSRIACIVDCLCTDCIADCSGIDCTVDGFCIDCPTPSLQGGHSRIITHRNVFLAWQDWSLGVSLDFQWWQSIWLRELSWDSRTSYACLPTFVPSS